MPYSDPEQQRKYQREYAAKRRAAWFAENGPCIDCGSRDSLELDHVGPSTKVSHNVWSWSAKRREEELRKCVVRCRECHSKRTAEQHRRPITHGTQSGYTRWCRCAACTKAHAEYNKQHRIRANKGNSL